MATNLTAEVLLQRARDFEKSIGRGRPTRHNWLERVIKEGTVTKDEAVQMAQASRPVVHEKMLSLMEGFIKIKKHQGNRVEKSVYRDMDVPKLVDRLLRNRPLSFVGAGDGYTDRSGKFGTGDWEKVQEDERKMREYMSYDEVKLAALVQVAAPIAPINRYECVLF